MTGADRVERDIINAVTRAALAEEAGRRLAMERWSWDTEQAWANGLGMVVRGGRQALLFVLHERAYAWERVEPGMRARADQLDAGLKELATMAAEGGCVLLPHEEVPGDTPPNLA